MTLNLIQEHGKEKVMHKIYEEIQDVYLSDNRPWVIGYSGGKDSTLTVMVVFDAVSQLPAHQRKKRNTYCLIRHFSRESTNFKLSSKKHRYDERILKGNELEYLL